MSRANPHPAPAPPGSSANLARILAVAALGIAFAFAWSWRSGREERALLAMPAEERMELYRRQLADLTTLCAAPDWEQAFSPRCRDLARFLAGFPECDSSCRNLVDPWLPRPTR